MITCRFCGTQTETTFADLGFSPLSNRMISPSDATMAEVFYPLHVYVCPVCYLVQLEEFETPAGIFGNYTYFSSYSQTWLEHTRRYAEKMFSLIRPGGRVVEIASNDGYLLQYFKDSYRVLGVEPARNVAEHAVSRGIPTISEFFGSNIAERLCSEGYAADLMTANNVLAHVPDINDFIEGFRILLKPDGIVTFEFPHLLRLMQECQFDTIYHEHFSYLSLFTTDKMLRAHGLVVYDAEELTSHGGSLRLYVKRANNAKAVSGEVVRILQEERGFGLGDILTYERFAHKPPIVKRKLLSFLVDIKSQGKSIAGYGAAAKGNTMLNYCGIRNDFIDYVVDVSPHKQGKMLPGSHIPVFSPEKIRETKPDYLLILPWNLKDEIIRQTAYIREWGGKHITAIPEARVINED